jgi:ABC-type microcin C transport system permease subunit YejE
MAGKPLDIHWLMPVFLATWEAEIEGLHSRPAQAKKKSLQDLISTSSWALWHISVTTATEGSINKTIVVQAGLVKKKMRPYLKNNKTKKAWQLGSNSEVPV